MRLPLTPAVTLAAALFLAAPGGADDPLGPALMLELNRLDPVEGACRIMLVAENMGAEGLLALEIEAVLFDRAGQVAALTLLDLQDLPAGRMRVRSFDLSGLDCADLGRLLVNGLNCTPASAAACRTEPVLAARSDIEFRQ